MMLLSSSAARGSLTLDVLRRHGVTMIDENVFSRQTLEDNLEVVRANQGIAKSVRPVCFQYLLTLP